jgi:hypothetical protein
MWVGRSVSQRAAICTQYLLQGMSMSCHVMSCHVMSCHVMSCHVMSCHVMFVMCSSTKLSTHPEAPVFPTHRWRLSCGYSRRTSMCPPAGGTCRGSTRPLPARPYRREARMSHKRSHTPSSQTRRRRRYLCQCLGDTSYSSSISENNTLSVSRYS